MLEFCHEMLLSGRYIILLMGAAVNEKLLRSDLFSHIEIAVEIEYDKLLFFIY